MWTYNHFGGVLFLSNQRSSGVLYLTQSRNPRRDSSRKHCPTPSDDATGINRGFGISVDAFWDCKDGVTHLLVSIGYIAPDNPQPLGTVAGLA